MKKLMMVLLMAMVGVCFADYKTDFRWILTDSAKIEKGLAEATQAKNKLYIQNYQAVKLICDKDVKNISYNDLKKLFNDNKISDAVFVRAIRFHPDLLKRLFINVIDDQTLSDVAKIYIKRLYPTCNYMPLNSVDDIKYWREKFVNLDTLHEIGKITVKYANTFFNNYQKISLKLSAEEIKADTILMKRAWYGKMTDSDEWKKLLVRIELMNKSVQ